MELAKSTKDDLRTFINGSSFNFDIFVPQVVEILNTDPLFANNNIKCQKTTERLMAADGMTDILKYNLASMLARAEKFYRYQPLYNLTLEDYYLFFLYLGVIHESTHIYQNHCGREPISPYPTINELYRIQMDYILNHLFIDRLIYKRMHNHYFWEREANITSAHTIIETIDNPDLCNYAKMAEINYYFLKGYKVKNDKIISPVEQTLRYIRKKNAHN